MKSSTLSSNSDGEGAPTMDPSAPPNRGPISLGLRDQIRRVDIEIGTLEQARSEGLKICDFARSEHLRQQIYALEFERRALRLRLERV